MSLSLFEIAALLLLLSGLFGWLNIMVLRLPHTIGLLVMALVASITLLGLQKLFPGAVIGLSGALWMLSCSPRSPSAPVPGKSGI